MVLVSCGPEGVFFWNLYCWGAFGTGFEGLDGLIFLSVGGSATEREPFWASFDGVCLLGLVKRERSGRFGPCFYQQLNEIHLYAVPATNLLLLLAVFSRA